VLVKFHLKPLRRKWLKRTNIGNPYPDSTAYSSSAITPKSFKSNSSLKTAMSHHLAQVNIARMRSNPSDPSMSQLVSRIDEMNQLAERSPGFVWRLHGSLVTPEALRAFENYFTPFEPEHLFYNLSVWETAEDLKNYVYRTAHAEMLRAQQTWMTHFEKPQLALWWIPSKSTPTIQDSATRLHSLHQNGPTSFAFTLKQLFPKP
jgi:Domain of unknown function (DUF3291)